MSCIVARRTRRRATSWALVLLTSAATLVGTTPIAANPLNGTVVSGNATISGAGNTLTIHQSTDRAIINWQSFSIGSNEVTRFVQPGANSATLNRVTSGNPSVLLGTLQSNGQVILINPNGILVGNGATIDVGGFIGSTLDVDNQQFMRGGELHFSGDSQAAVVNYGRIRAAEGDVYLIGSRVENHGSIQAPNGTVGLAAAHDVVLADGAHPLLAVRPTSASLGGVVNTGTIDAVQAQLVAAHGNVYALAINNQGTIRATGSAEVNGRIYLTGHGGTIQNTGDLIAKSGADGGEVVIDSGDAGITQLSGNIDATGQQGGSVQVLGGEVHLSDAHIDASGRDAGGLVLVGGDLQGRGEIRNARYTTVDADSVIRADALHDGNGGLIVVWADNKSEYYGNITARGGRHGGNGGFVEVSGKQDLLFDGLVDTSAPNGDAGWLVLDPGTVNIGNMIGDVTPTGLVNVTASSINTNWASNNVLITTNDVNNAGPEDINVYAALFPDNMGMSTNRTLTLMAQEDINVMAPITNNGNGAINLFALGDISIEDDITGGGQIDIDSFGQVTISDTATVTGNQVFVTFAHEGGFNDADRIVVPPPNNPNQPSRLQIRIHICHRTASGTNPFNLITVDHESVHPDLGGTGTSGSSDHGAPGHEQFNPLFGTEINDQLPNRTFTVNGMEFFIDDECNVTPVDGDGMMMDDMMMDDMMMDDMMMDDMMMDDMMMDDMMMDDMMMDDMMMDDMMMDDMMMDDMMMDDMMMDDMMMDDMMMDDMVFRPRDIPIFDLFQRTVRYPYACRYCPRLDHCCTYRRPRGELAGASSFDVFGNPWCGCCQGCRRVPLHRWAPVVPRNVEPLPEGVPQVRRPDPPGIEARQTSPQRSETLASKGSVGPAGQAYDPRLHAPPPRFVR